MEKFDTARLVMRPLRAEDETLYLACYTDPLLMKHIAEPLTQEAALQSFKAALKISSAIPVRRYMWAIQEKTSGAPIGLLSLVCKIKPDAQTCVELGHFMLKQYHNKGFTLEAINKLIDVVFMTTDFSAFIVNHDRDNHAVTRVVKKLGFLSNQKNSGITMKSSWILSRCHWQELRGAANRI